MLCIWLKHEVPVLDLLFYTRELAPGEAASNFGVYMNICNGFLSYIISDYKKDKLRRASDVVSVECNWIDKMVSHLVQFAGNFNRGLFAEDVIGRSLFNGKTDYESLQAISDAMANYLNIKLSPKLVVNDRPNGMWDYEGCGSPGFTIFDGARSRIELFRFKKFTNYEYYAVLAHEMAHVFLKENSLEVGNGLDKERFTDVAAIFLGFGRTLLHGYQAVVWSEDFTVDNQKWMHHSYRVGYLTCQDVALVMTRLAEISGHKIEISCKNMPYKDIEWFRRAKKINLKTPVVKYDVINCQSQDCMKKIRIPVLINDIIVTCPACKKQFKCARGWPLLG